MSESVVKNAMAKGVARRVFGLVFFIAVIPMLLTALLSIHEFNRSLETEAVKSIRSSAKDYGIRILDRIESASKNTQDLARILDSRRSMDESGDSYLLAYFESVWVIHGSEQPIPLYASGSAAPDLSWVDQATDKNELVVSPSGGLIFFQQIAEGPYSGAVLAVQLDESRIWGRREELSFGSEFCVFSETGVKLHCTASVRDSLHSDLLSVASHNRNVVHREWLHDGEVHFAALWQLFVRSRFDAPSLDIVAIKSKAIAMQSSTDARRILVPAVLLVLVLAGIVGINVINRGLGPLRNLTLAANQLSNGNFEARVPVRGKDEFRWLAESFNKMAQRIGEQLTAQRAMSRIDRLILTGTKLNQVSESVVQSLIEFANCDSAAVIARNNQSPDAAKMVSLHGEEFFHDRIDLPEDFGRNLSEPRRLSLQDMDDATAMYAFRFELFEQNHLVQIPVFSNEELKGVLLLGFSQRIDLSASEMQRCIDLAGRFAVALSSVEREEALYHQAHYDQLTGLPNRQLLKDRLGQFVSAARMNHQNGAILFLDLDRFKEINDVYGHSAGDAILKQASRRIRRLVRETDTVARLGGDEFVVVLPKLHNDAVVRSTATRLLDSLAEAFTVNGTDHYLSASIGITMFPEDGATVETLLKNSDAAMYRAKEAGRGRFEFFSKQQNAESRRKINLERDLRAAHHKGQLELHYQPQFDLSSGEISGAEALLRWPHPDKGMISPAEFIPLAEDSDLIVEIGSWVIQRACEDLKGLLLYGLHPGPMSVNVSGRQLADDSFVQTVLDPVREQGFNPGYLQLEITETVVAQNRDKAIAILQSLRDEGVRVAIDDFGTGYSSLSYLQQMPFDVIKIDKSFIDRIGTGMTADNICRTIITMAEQLGKKSIAEGVEDQHQIDFLRENKCNFVQGFYYSKALQYDEFFRFVEKQDFHTQRRKALEII